MLLAPVQMASVPRQDGAGEALRELRRGLAPPGEESAPPACRGSLGWPELPPWEPLEGPSRLRSASVSLEITV